MSLLAWFEKFNTAQNLGIFKVLFLFHFVIIFYNISFCPLPVRLLPFNFPVWWHKKAFTWKRCDLWRVPEQRILELYCIRLLNGASFCENQIKLYLDTKHLEKRLKRIGGRGGGRGLVHFFNKVSFFHKKVLFLANMERGPKFLEYALLKIKPWLVESSVIVQRTNL